MAASLPPSGFKRRTALIVIIVAGVALALWSFQDSRARDRERAKEEFVRRTAIRHSLTREVLGRYEDALFGLSALFTVDQNITRPEFLRTARRLQERTPGALALEWVPLVPDARRRDFEVALQSSYTKREFAIMEHDAAGQPRRAADRPDYLPITYIQPLEGNESALGFDLQAGPTRAFLGLAKATRRITLSGQVRLVQAPRDELGLVMIAPVWRAGRPNQPPEAEQFLGYVQAVFLAHDLLERTRTTQPDNILDMMFIDASEPDPAKRLLYYRPVDDHALARPAPSEAEFRRGLAHELGIPIGGRDWRVIYRPRAGWLEEQFTPLPWVRTAGVLALTALLAGLIHSLGRRTALVEREVAERTAELRQAQQLLQEDIQQRQQAEEALRASQADLQAILDHSPNSIFVKDLAGRYRLINRQHSRTWQRPAADFIGRDDPALFPAELAASFQEEDRRVLAAQTASSYEVTVPLPGGSTTTFIVQKFPLRDAAGHIYGICGISTDITARKQAEAELQENRRQLSNLIGQLPGAAFRCLLDDHLTALFASEGMLLLTGYPADDFTAGRRHIPQLTVPADRPAVRAAVVAAVRTRQPFEVEYRFTHRDGQQKWVLTRGRPVYAADGSLRFLEGLAIDVTALKLAEEEKIAIERRLLEAQKLESLGVLAGGIAHDFNNILTSVLLNASLARCTADAAGPVGAHLEQIENAAHRAADLCQQMLAYAGKGKIVTDRVDLSELVRGTAALLEVTISKNTRLDLQLAAELPPVLADITQLRQIVMNLVINAADAIGDQPGRITIATSARTADPAFLRDSIGHPELPAGAYVGLEVADSGAGMLPETIARIFEPFFSTKFSGRGLGLSAVRGIVQAHRGALYVESQPGAGSTFRLLLPATQGPAVSSAPPFAPPPDAPVRLAGLVLVIDDEATIRDIVAAVLEAHGATVLTAAGGEEALTLLRAHADRVALILLDMTMPGISGEETLRRFRMINARHPVILMSGYSETEAMKRSTDLGVAGFVQKPFEIESFLARVKPFLR